jgi:uncharacterized protein
MAGRLPINEIESELQAAVSSELAALKSDRVVSSALNSLARLPDNLTYHSRSHTIDVLETSVLLGVYDGLSPRDLLLIAIAAAFHDAGFLVRNDQNEILGATMAAEAMVSSGDFTHNEIQMVRQMILDTAIEDGQGLSRQPRTKLSGYLLDADLANFGRDDFFEQTELLAAEQQTDNGSMLKKAEQLLQQHSWFTTAGKQLFSKQQKENARRLKQSSRLVPAK